MAAGEFDTVALVGLLDRARGGDRAAYDDLLRRCAGRLERMARRMLRSYPAVRRWEDTSDVLQNALIRLTRALEAVRPESTRAFFGLAAEQIRRELLDLARRYRGPHGLDKNYASVAGGPADQSHPGGPDPAAPEADDLDRWAALHEAVEGMPAEEREVFMLTFYHGWKQADIAELFGVDERTVRRRWRAACLALQEAVGGELPEG